jgi:DNA polymerase elongation subunit (family B)
MKLLHLDIETAPNLGFFWGLWDQNIGISQLVKPGFTLCWSAKWEGEAEVMFSSAIRDGHKKMLKRIHKLLSEADAVCHYNGKRFDIPTLNKEFLLLGMPPPPPYHQVDLLHVARRQFKFASNKLDFVAQQLGLGGKTHHKGFALWLGCMNGCKKSWAVMERYNKQDVKLLARLYKKLLPWITQHPNRGLYSDDSLCCPKCSSTAFQVRGYRYTQAGQYTRYQCTGCWGWFRGTQSVGPRARERFVNA